VRLRRYSRFDCDQPTHSSSVRNLLEMPEVTCAVNTDKRRTSGVRTGARQLHRVERESAKGSASLTKVRSLMLRLTAGVMMLMTGVQLSHSARAQQLLAQASVSTSSVPTRPRPGNGNERAGDGGIRGRVLAADTAAPLRGAEVRLVSMTNQERKTALTDNDGRYQFTGLVVGEYTLVARKGGYLSLSYGQSRPFEPERHVELSSSDVIDRIDFALPRGGVITGRVSDDFGNPLAGCDVTAMRSTYSEARRHLTAYGRAQTDDLGEYRLYGLPPARYYLVADLRDRGATEDRRRYAPVYYPSTSSLESAQQLSIGTGQSVSNVDFVLGQVQAARISGTALASDGRPMFGGTVNMVESDTAGIETKSSPIGQDGSFSIDGVLPGTYFVKASMPVVQPGTSPERAMKRVDVGEQDIEGVILAASRPPMVAGRILIDGRTPVLAPGRLIVTMVSSELGTTMPTGVKDDWTFALEVAPGHWVVRLTGGDPRWGLKAVRLNGQDITDSGTELGETDNVGELDIQMTSRPTEVSGTVDDGRGHVAADYSVVVFPRDKVTYESLSRRNGLVRSDRSGRYTVRGLPPGDYLAAALEHVDRDEATDPEFLEHLRDRAKGFKLRDEQVIVLDLSLVISR
jgi:hypothetical protein